MEATQELEAAIEVRPSRAADGATRVEEHLEATMVVGEDGSFAWHVNPSVGAETLESGGQPEHYVLTAQAPDGTVRTWSGVARRGDELEVLTAEG